MKLATLLATGASAVLISTCNDGCGEDTTPTPTPQPEALSYDVVDDFDHPGDVTGEDLVLFTSAADFEAYFGVPVPQSVDFTAEWAVYVNKGARDFPGNLVDVDGLVLSAAKDDIEVTTNLTQPGSDCEIYQTWAPPVHTLVTFDALAAVPTLSETAGTTTLDCATGLSEGATCAADDPCATGLLCHGLTRADAGFCRDTTQSGTFSVLGSISFDETKESPIFVNGLATVDEDIILSFTLDHPDPSAVAVSLRNPGGTEFPVWDHETAASTTVDVNRPVFTSGDESVNGLWTLIIEGDTTNTGTISGLVLEINSRYD